MADLPTYKSIHEKFEAVSKTARTQRGVSWYANPTMDKHLQDGNFVLVQIPDAQFNRRESDDVPSAWESQGYVKYVPQAKVDPPVEAKKVGRPPSTDTEK